MSCSRLRRHARPAPLWHRLRCGECRAAGRQDGIIALGLACLRAEPTPATGIRDALRAVGLDAGSNAPARLLWRRRFWRQVLRVLALFGLPTVVGLGWLAWIDRDPGVAVPAYLAPAVDGYPLLLAAGRMAVDDGRAAELALRSSYPSARVPVDAPAERAALLARNRAALAAARNAMKVPFAERPPAAPFPDQSLTLPIQLTHLLALDARVAMDRKDWAGAMSACLDAAEMGAQVQHGGPVIDNLTGSLCMTLGRENAWDIIPHLSGPEAERAARRLERIRAETVPFAHACMVENLRGEVELLRMFDRPHWRWTARTEQPALQLRTFLGLLPYSKRAILDAHREFGDRLVARAELPYIDRTRLGAPEPTGAMAVLGTPLYSGAFFDEAKNNTQNGLLQAALDLRAYRAARGRYPSALTQLEGPGEPPMDMFASPRTPLRYTPKGNGYLLYSVGPDGVDNGGRPVSRDQYAWTREAGDVVAGLNR